MPIQFRNDSLYLLTNLTFNARPNIMLQIFRVTGDWWLDRMTRREIPVSTLPLPTLVTYQLTLSPVASAWALCHQGVTSVMSVTLSVMRTSSPGRLSHQQRTLTSVWQWQPYLRIQILKGVKKLIGFQTRSKGSKTVIENPR